jgi:predicted alpha/beta-hydrolase family hydrolase
MTTESVRIPLEGGETVSGRLDPPAGRETGLGVVLAHGAGNDVDAPLLAGVAAGLSERGIAVLRFNFPYRDAGKPRPDPEGRLEAAWVAAWGFMQRRVPCRHLVAAGKSLGGRIASQMAAANRLAAAALVFYGYPLHAPGRKERPRDAHLYAIRSPMLFFAGTRDALCDLEVLDTVLRRLEGAKALITVEGGDHSFEVPRSVGTPHEAVHRRLVDGTVAFLEAHLGLS